MRVTDPTEAQFTDQLIEVGRLLGYKVAHFRPAKTSRGWRTPVSGDGAGWPDLTFAKPGRLIFAELKSKVGKLSPEQTDWLALLEATGAESYVWRPAQFEEAVEILRRS